VRERIPIRSILLNNFSLSIELSVPISTEKYRSTDISGDYGRMRAPSAAMARRVTKRRGSVPAIKRAIHNTPEWHPGAAGIHHHKATEVSRAVT